MEFKNNHRNGIYVSKIWLIHLLFTIVFVYVVFQMKAIKPTENWSKQSAYLALTMLIYQIISLKQQKKSWISFDICFVAFSYLFMFGQIFLVGIFNVNQIEALGYVRNVLDSRYSVETMYMSSLFILMAIQCIFLFLILRKDRQYEISQTYNPNVFAASVPMLLIGLPCHLLYSARMIIMAQFVKSYDAILDQSGLVDDFANFFVYGLICLVFSKRLDPKKARNVIALTVLYFAVVMALTGDRRYQIVAIIVIIFSYFKSYRVKLSFKHIGLLALAYMALTLFYVLREIRTDSLMSLGDFITYYGKYLFGGETNIFSQTLYEFGGSFYTMCLAIKFIPSSIPFMGGMTFVSGIIAIIPLGFLYQNSPIFQNGRLAAILMEKGSTTVGGSLFADLYGNFGWIGGIIASIMVGLILNYLFNKDMQNNDDIDYYYARYFIMFYALIHLCRASFTEVLRTCVWGLLLLYFAYRIRISRNT